VPTQIAGHLAAAGYATAPKFDPLISDPKMQTILTKRWQECSVCVKSGAPLAATVMMGGLLEGLLLAKINQLPNKTSVFSAAATPMDPKTGKALQLSLAPIREHSPPYMGSFWALI
jgi:hypothetical protein